MFFGKDTVTEITDHDGSKLITETDYFAGKPQLPVKLTRERRKKVMDQKQELEEYLRHSDEVNKDRKKLNPSFRIERTTAGDKNGYYFVVASYTILQQ